MDTIVGINELGLEQLIANKGQYVSTAFPEVAFIKFSLRLLQKGYKQVGVCLSKVQPSGSGGS